ncbi:MAG: hypothetical protein LBL01_03490 [Bifidobacteriaceae bacterium]|nr:hypothetical protein [Bifidobacteriaceae bacterium]
MGGHVKSRDVVRESVRAGFTASRRGRHTTWVHATGVSIPVPDSHREISRGVYSKISAAIAEAKRREEERA